MDHPAALILLFIIGMFFGGSLLNIATDDYTTRAMQCVQAQASSSDPVALCSKLLDVNQHHND